MFSTRLNTFRQSLLLGVAVLLSLPGLARAVSSTDFSSIPPTTVLNSANAKPLVMLLLGKDDALYKKAYTDLVDLTGDGNPNITYTDSFNYYGYFNSNTCYTYDVTNGYFVPQGATNSGSHYCTTSLGKYWSGNFLNWATMTRIDILRKVLYGGFRYIDGTGENGVTVLQRAYFPTDAHSFAKVYSGSDLKDLTPFTGGPITICNTTDSASGVLSQNDVDPPLMRVAAGDFSKWAANERWQCTWQAEHNVTANSTNNNAPDKTNNGLTSNGAGPDYNVRVQVCNGVNNSTNCTQYPDGDSKPTGLLQTYGETGKILFGLMTGSYANSRAGGVLRKNISNFSDEVNSSSDGTFTDVNGIVSTIDALRMHGYDYTNGTYNDTDNCPWGPATGYDAIIANASTTAGDCTNWGNPMSEMYLEAVRYFKGLSADPDFTADDSTYIPQVTYSNGTSTPALSTPAWTHPLNANNWCAKCSIIVLNTGPFSYDSDQIDTGFSDLNAGTTAEILTKQIGDWEQITGNSYFIGDIVGGTNTGDQNGLCTPKVINDFSAAIGPCPDEPRLGGSFDMAGIAYWAHTTNLNPAAPSGHSQTVNTYTVNLSSTTPVIHIKVPGTSQTVTLMPACQDLWKKYIPDPPAPDTTTPTLDSPPGDCRIVDMEITKPYTLDATGTSASGTIYVNWDDSEQGGDFDQDMWGTIDYTITSSSIDITTNVDYQSTPFRMGFGYVLGGTGTKMDGFHVQSGINGYVYTDPNPGTFVPDPTVTPTQLQIDCDPNNSDNPNGCFSTAAASTFEYTISTGGAVGILQDPLWYTAKYGGFLDLNSSHTITNTAQWDSHINSTGGFGSDGVPDNYFTSTDPGQLDTNLNRVLANITERVSSGTATAVIANSGTGTGMLVQALYQPVVTNPAKPSQRVTWVGMLHSLFLDANNNLREDGNQNGQLDDYTTDPVVSIFYDATTNQTELARYSTTDGITLTLNSIAPLSDLKPIWSARDQLATLNNNDIANQRTYNSLITPTNGRYIFTAIDSNNDGIIDYQDVIPFTDSAIDSSNFGWMDIQTDFNSDNSIDAGDADLVVDYVRGEEGLNNNTFRNRTIDYDQDNTDEVWRLGDIVHSTPLIVGAPSSNWDTRYDDNTYTTFRTDYADRRVMVYSGANDGMLHAFNGGFFDAINKKYDLTRAVNASINETAPPTADPLGSEIWAYVPSNLLPHLQWLTEPDYPHVYYVDGSPRAFDVNIFPSGTDSHGIYHPDGWGTILVVGMRLGGGPITYSPVSGRTVTSRSAYIIMDITDPEKPPVLLGEISDPALGFTTSEPSLIYKRVPGTGGDWSNPATNDWYLVFGSGPTKLSDVTSAQDAGLYVLNLKTMTFLSGFNPEILTDGSGNPLANSFVGDTNSVDWTNDFNTDASYFGIVGGGTGDSPSPAPTGRLMRLVTYTDTPSNWIPSTVINPNQPFVNRPETTIDGAGKWWLYAGTGRLFVADDNLSTDQQSFYGIKEQVDPNTGLPLSSSLATRDTGTYPLQNTTGVEVFVDGSLQDPLGVLPTTVTNFTSLVSEIDGMAGWYINFSTPSTGSTRNLGPSTMFRLLTLFTSYTPSGDSCLSEGSSSLYAVYYKTGTAYPNAGVGNTTPCSTCTAISEPSTDLGTGLLRNVVVVSASCSGSNCGTAIGGSSTGAIVQTGITGVPTPSGRQSWRQIILQ